MLFYYGKNAQVLDDRHFLCGIAVVILVTTYFVNGPFFGIGQAVFLFYFGLLKNPPNIDCQN